MSPAAPLTVFVVTTALAIARPLRSSEAVWTCLGAGVCLLLGLVTAHDVSDVVRSSKDALLFLLALLVLADLIERSGFFEWAAIGCARRARGDARVLYRNVFLLGATVTAFLSLDTTAVILTPIVLAFTARLRLPARPYVFACAFVANAASLPLPISNLTNLLFAGTFELSFAAFAAHMLLPQAAALLVTFALLRRLFRDDLARGFSVDDLPSPASVIVHAGYFRASLVALVLVCAGYFVAPAFGVEPYVPAFAASFGLILCASRARLLDVAGMGRRIGWSIFPFVVGLFVVVRSVENLGFARVAVRWMQCGLDPHPQAAFAAVVAASAVASNVVNNLPAALLARGVLSEAGATPAQVYGALLGTNLGPNVLVFGSLATILVLGRARAQGVAVRGVDFVRAGLVVTPLALFAAAAVLDAECAW